MSDRKELPRCEYSLGPDWNGIYASPEECCNSPAVAHWIFDDGSCVYVCEEHDLILPEAEQ